MMIIGINKFSYTRLLIAILMVSSSTLLFAKKLDDQSLSEQYDSVAKLTPIIISAVRQDAQQPIDEQNSTQSEMAAKLADVAKKNEIYSTVLTDYEWKKKDRDSSKPGDQYVRPYERYNLVEEGYNPYQRHNVTITTKDRTTVYIGREIDAGDIINR